MSEKESFPDPEGEFISPSAIETWRLCRRKWAWSKIDKIQKPSNIAAEKGTIIHEVLEGWLKEGKAPDLEEVRTLSDNTVFKPGRIAAAGLKHLPMPKTCGTERYIYVKTEKAKYHGYIDWDLKPLAPGDTPVVGDHKSTSDFKWAKTEEELLKDPQSTIYAAAIMNETGAHEVELRWVYYKTTGTPASKKVSLVMLKDQVEKNFDELDVTALEIIEARKMAKTALDLEPNVRACDNYGGCVYRENCNLSTTDRLKGLMAQESLADKMEKRKNGTETNTEETSMATLAERMRERAAAAGAGAAVNGTPAAAAQAPASTGAAKMAASTLGINPPEGSTTREAAPPAAPAAGEAAPPKRNRLQRSAPAAAPAGSAPAAGAGEASTTPTAAPAAFTAPAANQSASVVPASGALSALSSVSFVLYVDCVPTKIRGPVMCVNSRTPEGAAAIKALENVATDVVRAIG